MCESFLPQKFPAVQYAPVVHTHTDAPQSHTIQTEVTVLVLHEVKLHYTVA